MPRDLHSRLASRIGPIFVNGHGHIGPAEPHGTPGFSVRWRDRPVHVSLVAPHDAAAMGGDVSGDPARASAKLDLEVQLGIVPSTGANATSSEQKTARARLFAALREVPRHLPDGWQIALLPDHRVALHAGRGVAAPIAAADLVTQVTLFLLDLAPYLDIVEEAGLAPPSPGARFVGAGLAWAEAA